MKKHIFIFAGLLSFFITAAAQVADKKTPGKKPVTPLAKKNPMPPIIDGDSVSKADEPVKDVPQITVYSTPNFNTVKQPFKGSSTFLKISEQDGNSSNYVYGVADVNGKIILPVMFSSITELPNGNVLVRLGRACALYSNQFKLLLPMEYSDISSIKDQAYYLVSGLNSFLPQDVLDANGKTILPAGYSFTDVLYHTDTSRSHLIKIQEQTTQKYGVFDVLKKQLVLDCVYDEMFLTGNQIQVKKDGLYNILGNGLRPLFPVFLRSVSSTGRGQYIIDNGTFSGVSTEIGKMIIPAEYKNIFYSFGTPGFFIVNKNGQWGILNDAGAVVFAAEYQAIQNHGQNILALKKQQRWSIKNITGAQLLPPEYDTIYSAYSMLVAKGKQIVKFDLNKIVTGGTQMPYTDIRRFSFNKNYFLVTVADGKLGLLDEQLKELLPPLYTDIQYALTDKLYFTAAQHKKYGLFSSDGRQLQPCKYEVITPLAEKRGFLVKQQGLYGLLNSFGAEMSACIYDYIGTDSNDRANMICVKGAEIKKIRLF